MKTKEYLVKYDLSSGWKKEAQAGFIQDLAQEFIALCEYNHSEDNIRGFNNSVTAIRQKWDSISNKIPYGIPENLWKYFFATIIAPARENFCPAEMQRRKEEAEQRHQAYLEAKQRRKEMEDFFTDRFREQRRRNFILFLAAFMSLPKVPDSSFAILGLPSSATAEEISAAYRERSKQCHPDHGGNQADFIRLTEAKNRCLAWVGRNMKQ